MPSKNNFIAKLKKDFPDFRFISGRRFSFRPPKTIVIGPDEGDKTLMLLFHELGHALSGRYAYQTSVERLKIETIAWQTGKKAYQKYSELPPWDDDFVEETLDTYRDWLHQKSKCPSCKLTMVQTEAGKWVCPFCDQFKNPPLS